MPTNPEHGLESRTLDILDSSDERQAEVRAGEARGYFSALREHRIISHEMFKKADAEIAKALLDWGRKKTAQSA